MLIDSNIAGVMRQVERLKSAIPGAMERSLNPDRWYADARATAQRVLIAIAEPAERRFISQFVETVTATLLQPNGLMLQMRSPFPGLRDRIEEARAAHLALNLGDLSSNLFLAQVQEFEDLILDWVQTPEDEGGKKRDHRDWGKSDEEIAHLISYIMLSPNLGEKGKAAREALTPHIAAFLMQKQMDRLDGIVVDRWLRVVLAAWRELIITRYPAMLRAELRAAKGSLL
jgi:hypothetical protein